MAKALSQYLTTPVECNGWALSVQVVRMSNFLPSLLSWHEFVAQGEVEVLYNTQYDAIPRKELLMLVSKHAAIDVMQRKLALALFDWEGEGHMRSMLEAAALAARLIRKVMGLKDES